MIHTSIVINLLIIEVKKIFFQVKQINSIFLKAKGNREDYHLIN